MILRVRGSFHKSRRPLRRDEAEWLLKYDNTPEWKHVTHAVGSGIRFAILWYFVRQWLQSAPLTGADWIQLISIWSMCRYALNKLKRGRLARLYIADDPA